ncbi:MAG: hypothetical protein CVU71_10865 [Deltaproteobacteria bacterium HGW-Deltaproteobacteria-6]|jgi:radical SAM superfamily enzyme YgiQ (UPF0313 family)|nr:MAG: hypothetical protein CVU71_10865 [Deltaproteobacteria bacterium HGW-Deltaproteobacteria-6]
MNVLIVVPHMNALFKRTDLENVTEYPYNYTFPIGPGYISTALKNAGINTFCVDLNFYDDPMRKLDQMIMDHRVDVVGIGGLSREYWRIKHIFDHIRKHYPHIITILGGGIISAEPELIFTDMKIDFGVLGEGDRTIVELVRALESGGKPAGVNGIIFNDNGRPLMTPPRDVIASLDEMPLPDYDSFELNKYLDYQKCLDFWFIKEDNPRALPIVASRSCPHNCTFCYHTVPTYRQVSLDRLFTDIEYLVPKYNINFLFIYDDLFASSKNNSRLVEFCRRIKPFGLQWYCQLRIDSKIDEQVLQDMKESGCVAIGLGIEHLDEDVLKSMNKNIKRAQIDRTLPMVYDAQVGIAPNILIGDVRETRETINACYEWYQKNRRYQLSVVEVVPYPGTKLYKTAIEKGLIKDPLEYVRSGCPGINFTGIDQQEYAGLVRKFRDDFYQPAENVTVKSGYDPNRGDLYTIVARCTHCGEMNVYSNVSKVLVNELGCKKCNHRYYRFRNEDYYFYINLPKLKGLIDNNPDMAIGLCGPSKIIAALVNNLDEHYRRHVVKVFDINPQRQGLSLGQYTIDKIPEDLSELKGVLDIMFIAAQFSYTEIYNSIAELRNHGIEIV